MSHGRHAVPRPKWRRWTLIPAVLMVTGLLPGAASASTTTCSFTTSGTTMTLNGDCTTDTTIVVPDGFTLDGAGHAITGVDPAGGHFTGGVVANGGTVAHVTNLRVTVSHLANACDSGAARLRGILFEGASGTITRTTVVGINQGASGCQEGNAIEVRNAPFDGTHPNTRSVTIAGNRVSGYQKGGIVANGDVRVTVKHNRVSGLGRVGYIAQNGIQLGFGAQGLVEENRVGDNWYTGAGWTSAGILLYAAPGARVVENRSRNDQTAVYGYGDGIRLKENEVGASTWGLILWGDHGRADENEVRCSDVGIDVYGNYNRVKENEISGVGESSPCDVGILVEKDGSLGIGIGNVLEENEFENVTTPVMDPPPATPKASPSS